MGALSTAHADRGPSTQLAWPWLEPQLHVFSQGALGCHLSFLTCVDSIIPISEGGHEDKTS